MIPRLNRSYGCSSFPHHPSFWMGSEWTVIDENGKEGREGKGWRISFILTVYPRFAIMNPHKDDVHQRKLMPRCLQELGSPFLNSKKLVKQLGWRGSYNSRPSRMVFFMRFSRGSSWSPAQTHVHSQCTTAPRFPLHYRGSHASLMHVLRT